MNGMTTFKMQGRHRSLIKLQTAAMERVCCFMAPKSTPSAQARGLIFPFLEHALLHL